MSRIKLPERGHLEATGPVDTIADYHRPGIGAVLRWRLGWVLAALPGGRLGRVLEVGYGSGVFQYELAARCDTSVGLDVHERGGSVRRLLEADGVEAVLVRGDGGRLPFADGTFDAVVAVSVLEFVPSPGDTIRECLRVLRPEGRLVCVTPRPARWSDALYRALSGKDPESGFQGGRERVQGALADLSSRLDRAPRPAWLPAGLAPYELVTSRSRAP